MVFIPPRTFPGDDANYLASWPMNEGTGVTIDNIGDQGGGGSGPANRDGTLANGTWEAQWDQDTTPVIPYSLEFFQQNDGIDFGSGANIDDLPTGDCTIEFWARIPTDISDGTRIVSKSNAVVGWEIFTDATGIEFRFDHASDFDVNVPLGKDNIWHHWAVDWNQGTLTGRVFLDGVVQGTDTAIGAYGVDAAWDCLVNAYNAIGTGDGAFAIGPIALSNIRRYTGTYFVPAPRTNWHANDANYHLITTMRDGAGVTVTDYSGNGYNGTVTFGATTRWNVTPDMAIDAPGARMFNGGYSIGADAANDGFTQIITGLTPGDDYVVRALVSWDPDVVAQPGIRIYDEIGAAQIVQFAAPLLTAAHTGANNLATLIVAGARFTQSMVGLTLDNVTDGSTTTVTAVSGDGTTVTGVLAGGTDNDWDTGDVARFQVPANWTWAETFCFTLPAGCTSASVQARNLTTTGLFYLPQIEVIPNLLQTGDMEVGAGNPYIPTGWAGVGLAAGESLAEAVIIHAGAQSLEFVAAADGDGIRQQITAAVGDYVHVSMWSYGDGAAGFTIGGLDATQLLLQSSTTAFNVSTPHTAVWSQTSAVFRVIAANPFIYILADAGAGGLRYIDDVSAFVDNAITLTVTPANAANSLESGGIRVDGYDNAQQPIPVGFLSSTFGWIRWRGRPRHADGNYQAFQEAATPFMAWFSAPIANYITVDFSAVNTIRLEVNDGAVSNGLAVAPGLVADTEYLFEILYTGAQITFSIDGVVLITVTPGGGIDFGADIPTAAWWGSRATNDYQADMVFINP